MARKECTFSQCCSGVVAILVAHVYVTCDPVVLSAVPASSPPPFSFLKNKPVSRINLFKIELSHDCLDVLVHLRYLHH